MAEIIFASRIVNKHDSQTNWDAVNKFIPKNGEIIIYDPDDNYNYARLKIGDGMTSINSLPFVDDALRDYVDTEIIELSNDIDALNTLVGDTSVSSQITNAIAAKADIAAGVYAVAATSNDGIAYTATVPGINALVSGASFIMVPAVVSNSLSPTINVNGLGAKSIKRRLSNLATTLQNGYAVNWLTANTPFTLVYDGTAWIVEGLTKPVGADLYGAAPRAEADADGNVITDTYATKSRTEIITIPVSAWTGTKAPYFAMNQACSIATMTNKLIVSPSPTLTNPDDGMAEILSASTYNAIAEARIMAVVQADGGITFAAYGKKPEIDIPVIVTEVG